MGAGELQQVASSPHLITLKYGNMRQRYLFGMVLADNPGCCRVTVRIPYAPSQHRMLRGHPGLTPVVLCVVTRW